LGGLYAILGKAAPGVGESIKWGIPSLSIS